MTEKLKKDIIKLVIDEVVIEGESVKIFATIPLPNKIHEREMDKTDIPGTFNAGATLGPVNETNMARIWNKHKQSSTPLKRKVFIGLSGGVDSAVSAFLLCKQGFQVEGVFLKNWSSTIGLLKSECPWLKDRQDALRVAAFLNIPLHTVDFEKEYKEKVMKEFFSEYKAGRTPNPDVLCNEYIKFGLMYKWAMEKGFDFVATGHYARIVESGKWKVESKRQNPSDFGLTLHSSLFTLHFLQRSKDAFKDQTYFLYRIKKEYLPHILFPIGGMKKAEVKKLAKKVGLPVAGRKESMGLCFVGKVRLKDFLKQGIKENRGKIVLLWASRQLFTPPNLPLDRGGTGLSSHWFKGELEGVEVGTHQGLQNYTVGQRHGIQVASSAPYYVVSKDLKKNILYVTDNPEDERLFVKQVGLRDCNWLASFVSLRGGFATRQSHGNSTGLPRSPSLARNDRNVNNLPTYQLRTYNFLARFRHQGELVPAKITKLSKTTATVEFQTKQKALASGQSLVLYDDNVCLGGGIIV